MSVLPNTNIEMPCELSQTLKDYSFVVNNEGYSQAMVFKCEKDKETFYLKAEQSNSFIKREYSILKWLSGKLPVPEIKYYDEYNGLSFMLTTAIKGYKAGTSNDEVRKPFENTIRLLADGLLMFQSIDISDCPFTNNFNVSFKNAAYNIETNSYYPDYISVNANFANIFNFNDSNDKSSITPLGLYNFLNKNKPQESREEICFSHGDYGLTNTFIDGNSITGFIDIGGGGIADKWNDIAICVRSIGYHSRSLDEMKKYVDLLFERLSIVPDWDKINYYIWFSRMINIK